MKWLRFALLAIIAALIQAGIFANWRIRPDLLLILLVFFAIYSNTRDAIITSFTLGFVADIIGPSMGPYMLAFGLIGTSLANLHKVLAVRKAFYQGIIIFVVGLLSSVLVTLLMLLRTAPTKSDLYNELLWIPLYSAAIGPFLFLPLGWWMRIKLKRFSRS